MSTQLVNAWIYLDEDEPSGTNYNSPNSCYQRLIQNNIYQSVNILYICFVTTTTTSEQTIPAGDGSSYTIQISPESQAHPNELTNQDYLEYIIKDARANNPNIKIAVTLSWGHSDVISSIFSNSAYTPEQNAQNFAANLMTYLQNYDLDGFDIDWESPVCNNTTQEQFKLLIDAIGSQFKQQTNKHYYLTLSPAESRNLDVDAVNNYVDFVNLQLYSGFTHPSNFKGINPELFAYGAKFETAGNSGYETAEQAYQKNQKNYHYSIFTNWRLNSDNYVFEQDEQQKLYQLVFNNNSTLTLEQWVGTYAKTTYFYPGSQYPIWADTPVLKIEKDDSGKLQVLLSGSVVNNWTYNSSNCQLSWQITEGNWSAANLTLGFDNSGQKGFAGSLEVGGGNSQINYQIGAFSGVM